MTDPSFTFRFEQDVKTAVAGLKTRAPTPQNAIKGTGWAAAIRLLHCLMLGFGALGVAIALEYLASGQIRLSLWSCAIGVALLYLCILGGIFVTLPQLAQRALAARMNAGTLQMTFDKNGIYTRTDNAQSHIKWSGVDATSLNKQAMVFWLGMSRISLPYSAIGVGDNLEIFEKTVSRWMEASR